MNRTAAAALDDADLVRARGRGAASGPPRTSWCSSASRAPAGRCWSPSTRSIGCSRASGCCPISRSSIARHEFLALVPVSALKGENLEDLRRSIAAHLPRLAAAVSRRASSPIAALEFRIAEMIREKLTLELDQEVPYGIAVEVEQLAEEDGQLSVDAAIWVDRDGQKPIVIGAEGRAAEAGRALGAAGAERAARAAAAPDLWVKVRENWADNARALQRAGAGMSAHDRASPPRRARAGLHPAPPAVPGHQPDPRGADARSRAADAVCARRARAEAALRGGAAAVSSCCCCPSAGAARRRSSPAPRARRARRRLPRGQPAWRRSISTSCC